MAQTGDLESDVALLEQLMAETISARDGEAARALVDELRRAAVALRAGELAGGRAAFSARVQALDLASLERVARVFTQLFHLINASEEQQRIRALRRMDRPEQPADGSIAAALSQMARAGVPAEAVRALLSRLFIMPVLTAHPTEARRRTVRDHLQSVSAALDGLDDPRPGVRERARLVDQLRHTVLALYTTEEARSTRPTPVDEVRAGLHIFERTLLEVTPAIYRELEDALDVAYPDKPFTVGPFLRYGTWIGGDRDGNPHVTAEVTRSAFERYRAVVLERHLRDLDALGKELSMSGRRVGQLGELEASLAADCERSPELAARARRYVAEPFREKLRYMQARLGAARDRREGGYPDAHSYLEELELLQRSLALAGLPELARGRLRDAWRRAQVFGFHLASLDIRQHSAVHEAAVAELLARGGVPGYEKLPEGARAELLCGLLDRSEVGATRDRKGLSPATREVLATLDVVGRARRDAGPEACERYVVSFTSEASDLLEVAFLCRAAQLAVDELKPVPLLEQRADLEGAARLAERMLELRPLRVAMRGELEVMIGYSDSGKESGYVSSAIALARAQEALAQVAEEEGVVLTIFHGRGGAIGRGGGPANRSIRAQPPRALKGRLRLTEQGETITARYGRREIARRDLEQMVHAVLLASSVEQAPPAPSVVSAREAVLERAATTSRKAYEALVGDGERLATYALLATPIEEVAELPIGSRPAARGTGKLSIERLRAIPWVFSWAQSRHGLPGWYGLGSALEALVRDAGLPAVRAHYADWPLFRALIDNAQIALARADIDVAAEYARLAGAIGQEVFPHIRAEHARTVGHILSITGTSALLSAWPTIAHTVERRNPYVDVLSHTQIELLGRLRAASGAERERIREVLFVTINGIAAGLQTAG